MALPKINAPAVKPEWEQEEFLTEGPINKPISFTSDSSTLGQSRSSVDCWRWNIISYSLPCKPAVQACRDPPDYYPGTETLFPREATISGESSECTSFPSLPSATPDFSHHRRMQWAHGRRSGVRRLRAGILITPTPKKAAASKARSPPATLCLFEYGSVPRVLAGWMTVGAEWISCEVGFPAQKHDDHQSVNAHPRDDPEVSAPAEGPMPLCSCR